MKLKGKAKEYLRTLESAQAEIDASMPEQELTEDEQILSLCIGSLLPRDERFRTLMHGLVVMFFEALEHQTLDRLHSCMVCASLAVNRAVDGEEVNGDEGADKTVH